VSKTQQNLQLKDCQKKIAVLKAGQYNSAAPLAEGLSDQTLQCLQMKACQEHLQLKACQYNSSALVDEGLSIKHCSNQLKGL